VLLLVGFASAAHAYYLDAGRNFDFRARLYGIRRCAEGSAADEARGRPPAHRTGRSSIPSSTPSSPCTTCSADDLCSVSPLWGFDGVYDYGTAVIQPLAAGDQARLVRHR
jgi:hypothetical protein